MLFLRMPEFCIGGGCPIRDKKTTFLCAATICQKSALFRRFQNNFVKYFLYCFCIGGGVFYISASLQKTGGGVFL